MDGHERDLIQSEGVNAGSARLAAQEPDPGGDVSGGGHPERAEEQAGRQQDVGIVDAPFLPRDAGAPSLEQSAEEGAR